MLVYLDACPEFGLTSYYEYDDTDKNCNECNNWSVLTESDKKYL